MAVGSRRLPRLLVCGQGGSREWAHVRKRERDGDVMGVRGAALDLRAFLLRGHSLRLYRAALLSTRRAPAYSREDLERTIRHEFEQHRFERNSQTIRFLLSDALQRLKQLNTMLGIQGNEDDVRM